MAMIQSLLHYGSYLAAFYAAYVVVGMALTGVFLWRVLSRKPAMQSLPARVEPTAGDESRAALH
ncbi:hypothetical protein E2K99_18010 [Herbaspirillum huttiense]|jgi:hypothetical protein|nr:hypothetical protein [Herbaspirillum sp.]QBP76778.1 hypothetical protein E2K99_18010 [Herbaspirillum huttiense]MBO14428.1 hypothetical protein [Herbaspirillum sp.]MCP3657485.1 hypothetical protein [Herbaspirillum sp.]MCP3949657.1 hypothetical protein [Herbaspirillum sp.]|tara:strand:+ start:1508 stop:1699 length:192 start_codon:yes stop_codon:yes gene_type:complete